ncbi:MAG: K(+)-transporting ATPase subunit B [Methanobacteriales archaeon HGW-Methanobacteriales-2]|nr:MAG: K(+)-transporting ATPase subunit B [Methanobacteriales archaeon HGW-Methanobacteriales-2]
MDLMRSEFILPSLRESVKKLNPFTLWRNPVMFVVEIGSIVTTIAAVRNFFTGESAFLPIQISIWLWATVIFANFAESLAEIKGKARAESLRSTKNLLTAARITESGKEEQISAALLKKGDIISVHEGDTIPGDGDIIQGTGLIDESAITGESAPVIRESGGDRCGVTGGTKLISGNIRIKIAVNQGESFLDSMIKMVEGAKRQKSPNEAAMDILIFALTILFLVVVVTLPAFAKYMGFSINITVLVALLVCLMPTTIGGLLPAIGIAGMDRVLKHNVIAMSGRAIEAAGDVNIVLLDKTGTITLGNRMASELIPAEDVDMKLLVQAAMYSSLADETPEGRSIVILAKKELGIHGGDIRQPEGSVFIPFTPESAMSGIDMDGKKIRKGSLQAIEELVEKESKVIPDRIYKEVDNISMAGDTPLVVVSDTDVLGVIRLKDIVKSGIAARIAQLRKIGIKSVMITGDTHLTAASIAAEAGLDDFIAQAKPETKLNLIRSYQNLGNMVAMIGDGTNDAPALAQADVAVAMNAGTQAAREAANMIDLDSSPTKLLDIVEIGKEILITRGALTTFSIANDVAKYFAIIPAVFAVKYPELGILNIMRLESTESAVLSAVIFNALIIPALIPVALRGVKYSVTSVSALLRRNLLIYGLGGIILPFVCIKCLDLLIKII